jgi:hypothetical protein
MSIDPTYLPAVAALVGSAIGGFTSLATTWLTQHGQAKLQQLTRDRVKRETLFAQFIDEASMLYADALTHDGADLAKMARLYAMISRMRLLSSKNIVEHAELVSHKILELYLAPNKTFHDVLNLRETGVLDPLKQFSEACREELYRFDGRQL